MKDMQRFVIVVITPLILVGLIFAQPSFRVVMLEGTVKIQRSQKKTWENLGHNDEVNDKDIIETFFQTKLILQYGAENAIVIGSNSRILLNIEEDIQSDPPNTNVNMTVFSGGALTKITANSLVNIYTANAVAQIDSGTISTVVEAKTGHTGFQMLSGSASARNISQQEGRTLNAGLTTIILPGKEPTAPLYITYRHVAVLKHFFGEEFIDREIEAAGITPSEDKSMTNRLSLSQNLEQGKGQADGQMYKKLFSYNRIFGLILDDQARKKKIFKPIKKSYRISNKRGEVKLNTSFAITGGKNYPNIAVLPSFYLANFSVGLNLPFAKNYSEKVSMNIASASGFFDKIHHLTIGDIEKTRFLHFGPINELTIAEGLVVNKFENKSIYSVTQPLGLNWLAENDAAKFNLFIADITNWNIGGLHLMIYPGNAMLGCGYYYDADLYKQLLSNKISRFIDIEKLDTIQIKVPNEDAMKSHNHIYELNFGFWHRISASTSLNLLFQFASKMGKQDAKGFVLKGPEVQIEMDQFNFGLSYITEKGKLLAGHLSSMYMSNRLRQFARNDSVYNYTQNNIISPHRKAFGFDLFFKMKPFKGSVIDFTFRQDFITKYPFTYLVQNITDSVNIKNNFALDLSMEINQELWGPIKYAQAYIKQVHGGLFPKTARYFTSWGFSTGFELLTAPLFFNLAFEAGLDFSYIDLNDQLGKWGQLNNNIDAGDNMLEFYLGIRWGYL